MRFGLFGKGDAGKAESSAHAARIKVEVRDVLDLPAEAVVAVNEILCADPACPGTETVILVMNPGEKTKAFKATMPMAEVTREALDSIFPKGAALTPPAAPPDAGSAVRPPPASRAP